MLLVDLHDCLAHICSYTQHTPMLRLIEALNVLLPEVSVYLKNQYTYSQRTPILRLMKIWVCYGENMTRIPKKNLDEQQITTLFTQLNTVIANLNQTQANQFLFELLVPEERIMIAKRLAAIILLLEGRSRYFVAQTLHMSQSTITILHSKIKTNQYTEMTRLLGKNKKNYFAILDTLDSILHLGGILPHYNGLDRYKHIR